MIDSLVVGGVVVDGVVQELVRVDVGRHVHLELGLVHD